MSSERESSEPGALPPDLWERICNVLDRVLDADPETQAGVLAEACQTEGVPLTDAARYLEAARIDSDFLTHLPHDVIAGALQSCRRESLTPGNVFGTYEVVAAIGTGGMGE